MPPVLSLQQWPRGPLNPLHRAATDGSVERTIAIISKGKGKGSIDINQGTPQGYTPLMLASLQGHGPVVRILLSKGANLSIAGDRGVTPLCAAAGEGHVDVVKMLIEAGGGPAVPSGAVTPLHVATRFGHPEVMKILIKAGANVNHREVNGETALCTASVHGLVGAVRLLLRAKADPFLTLTSSDGEEYLPLDLAADRGHSEVVRELLQQVGIEGCGGPSGGYHALCSAAGEKRLDIMAILTDTGVADTGYMLNNAAGDGMDAQVKFLVQHQAGKFSCRSRYLNFRNDFGATPLLNSVLSCHSRSPRIVQLLVDAGADTTSAVRITRAPRRKFISSIPVTSALQGDPYFNDTPLAFTNHCLRDKKILGTDATKEQLRTLEATRRLLLRVEAVCAVA